MTLGAAGALFVFVRDAAGPWLPLKCCFIAQNPLSAWAESSLGAPKTLPVLILGWAEAEVSRAGMSSPCDGGAWARRTRGTVPGHAARGCPTLLCLSRKSSASPRSCDCPKQPPGEGIFHGCILRWKVCGPLREVFAPVCARSSAALRGRGTAAASTLWERRRCPEPAEVFSIPSTKAHSLLSQIRMKRFPFQLLPPSLCVYLNPQPRGFSANKLPSFQVAFPFSHCFWQPVHVKLHKWFFILGVFVLIELVNGHTPSVQLPGGVTASLRCGGFAVGLREFQPGKDPCCSSSSCGNPA